MKIRPYLVSVEGSAPRLVVALNAALAARHVIRDTITVSVPTAAEMHQLGSDGIKMETAEVESGGKRGRKKSVPAAVQGDAS